MQKYTDTVIKDGKPIQGLTVNVVNSPAGTPATIYSSTGSVVPSVQTDSNGRFEFYAPNGHYSFTVSGAGINPYTLNDVVLFDAADQGVAAIRGGGSVTLQSLLDAKAPLASPSFTGSVGIGASAPTDKLDVRSDTADTAIRVSTTDNATVMRMGWRSGAAFLAAGGYGGPALALDVNGSERARLTGTGSLLLGVTSGAYHKITKNVTPNSTDCILETQIAGAAGIAIFGTTGAYGSNAGATMWAGRDAVTLRSFNASGTVNASGADYAEYMQKSLSCGVLTKGQIVGINAAGELVDTWTDSVSFLIKSTDPSYVGGDNWGDESKIGLSRPKEPIFIPPGYVGAPDPGSEPVYYNFRTDDDFQRAVVAYRAAKVQYQQDQADHMAAVAAAQQIFDTVTMPAYQAALAVFNAALEAARLRVDRIAYCGQVPVNALGAVPGQYVVPVQDGEGIGAKLVSKSAMTLAQYMAAVGVVQNILPDGRANVRVKPV